MERVAGFIKDNILLSITLAMLSVFLSAIAIIRPVQDNLNDHIRIKAYNEQLAEFSAYDGHPVTGSSILTAMRRYAMKSYTFIYVNNGGSTFVANPASGVASAPQINFSTGQVTSSSTVSASVSLEQMKLEGGPYYIAPQDSYKSRVVTDPNRRIVGVLFIKQ